jgi:hypothetical protein
MCYHGRSGSRAQNKSVVDDLVMAMEETRGDVAGATMRGADHACAGMGMKRVASSCRGGEGNVKGADVEFLKDKMLSWKTTWRHISIHPIAGL